MAYTFHNSKADGTIDQEIVSGQDGALFSTVTVAERTAGDVEYSKMWITADEDANTYIGENSKSAYGQYVFLSAATDTDAESDLTGSERKYGAMEVVSATAAVIVVKNDPNYDIVQAGDTIAVKEAPYLVDTVTDNGDGTSNISASIDFVALPIAGEFISSMFTLATTTAVPKAFWRQRTVEAGATWSGGAIVVDILIGK